METQTPKINPVKLAIYDKIATFIRDHSMFHMFCYAMAWMVNLYLLFALHWSIFLLGTFCILGVEPAHRTWMEYKDQKQKTNKEVGEGTPREEEYFFGIPIEALVTYLLSGQTFGRDPVFAMWRDRLGESDQSRRAKFDELKTLFIATGLLTNGPNGSWVLNQKEYDTREKIKKLLSSQKQPEIVNPLVFRPLRPTTARTAYPSHSPN